jgi:hypothetical protein
MIKPGKILFLARERSPRKPERLFIPGRYNQLCANRPSTGCIILCGCSIHQSSDRQKSTFSPGRPPNYVSPNFADFAHLISQDLAVRIYYTDTHFSGVQIYTAVKFVAFGVKSH